MPSMIESPLARLSEEQIEELGREFDAIHDEVFAELGDRDRRYIVSMIEMHRRLVVLGRVLLLGSRRRPAWLAGTTLLSMAKILENMEIGHNVMHGQWDWMNDPQISSSTWDWDSASTAEAWKHSHNYVHHTYTNIRGKDRDLGYEIMRIDPHQKWHPVYLLQPFYNLVLAAFFEWGRRLARPRHRSDQEGREVQGAAAPRGQGHAAQGPPADRQGLPRLAAHRRAGDRGRARRDRRGPAAVAARARGPASAPQARAGGNGRRARHRELPLDAGRGLHGERRAQRVGLRDHLLRALPPTRRTPSARTR
ncbi:MAG TPA: fatty acid desaturase [Solirubrobacteraceae bacterium]|nr:fatty acid desaturase [Solirubrobacteraceae bacterium]